MSRCILATGLLSAALLTGCAGTADRQLAAGASPTTARATAWNKYRVAGSRIPRTLDANGQPLTGSHITTVTDEDLQSSSGVLLGDKLSGGYPR